MWVGAGNTDEDTMAMLVRDWVTTRRRTMQYAVVAVLVVVLVAGIAFFSSSKVSRVAEDAQTLHWHDRAIGSSELVMIELTEAVTLAELQGGGEVTPADVAFAVDRLERSHRKLQLLHVDGQEYEGHASLARFLASVGATIDALGTGDVAGAREIVGEAVSPALGEALSVLADGQAQAEEAISGDTGPIFAGWAEFALLLVVPVCVAAGAYLIARIRIRSIEERLGREVEGEREVDLVRNRFLSRFSFDLRTRLTSIYGFAELLKSGEVVGVEATRETAQMIVMESVGMARKVEDLMMASQLQGTGLVIEKKETRINSVIESAIAPFERAGVEIVTEPTAAMVDTDPERLRQVLINLISNAVRHGGPEIGIEVTITDAAVDIEVMDNGPGIPEKNLRQVLEVISNTSGELLGGPGLGLAIAARTMTLLDGVVRYQRYGARTYFVVTLPAASDQPEEDDEPSVADMIRVLSS